MHFISLTFLVSDLDLNVYLILLFSGVNSGPSEWTVQSTDFVGLALDPIPNSDEPFNVTVYLTAQETATLDTIAVNQAFSVELQAVADLATVQNGEMNVTEDNPLVLVALADIDLSEVVVINVTGVPAGGWLNIGNLTDPATGKWEVTQAQFIGSGVSSLVFWPPLHWHGNCTLQIGPGTVVELTNQDSTPIPGNTLDVTVLPIPDAPLLEVNSSTALEDATAQIVLAGSLVDPSEAISDYVITGVPLGWSLVPGTESPPGTWTVPFAPEVTVGVTAIPHQSGVFSLSVSLTSSEQSTSDSATTAVAPVVSFTAVADAATLAHPAVISTYENGNVTFDIACTSVDSDGSEVVTLSIIGLPGSSTSSSGAISGTVLLFDSSASSVNITGVSIFLPPYWSGNVSLGTVCWTEEGNGDRKQSNDTMLLSVHSVPTMPSMVLTNSPLGNEDSAIAVTLDIDLVDTDGSETLSTLRLSELHPNATVSPGTRVSSTSWTLSGPSEWSSFAVTPPSFDSTDFSFIAMIDAIESDTLDSISRAISIPISVTAVANPPFVGLVSAGSGPEDTAITAIVDVALVDFDSSETLSVQIHSLPTGSSVQNCVPLSSTSCAFNTTFLPNIVFTPALHDDTDITLVLEAIATEQSNNDEASSMLNVSFEVIAVTDPIIFHSVSIISRENDDVVLPIALVDPDLSEHLYLNISLPPDFVLLPGSLISGSWIAVVTDGSDVVIRPPLYASGVFFVNVTAYSQEQADSALRLDAPFTTITLTIRAGATPPQTSIHHAMGLPNKVIALSVNCSLTDPGEILLPVHITGLPPPFLLSSGVYDTANDTWVVPLAEMHNLTVSHPGPSAAVNITLMGYSFDPRSNTTANSTAIASVQIIDLPATLPPVTKYIASVSVRTLEDTIVALGVLSNLSLAEVSPLLSARLYNVYGTLTCGSLVIPRVWEVLWSDLASCLILPLPFVSQTTQISAVFFVNEAPHLGVYVRLLNFSVEAVANTPLLEVPMEPVVLDQEIHTPLSINSSLVDLDGSEELSLTISSVPACLSFNLGAPHNTTWVIAHLEVGKLSNLTVYALPQCDGAHVVEMSAESMEVSNNDTSSIFANFTLHVLPQSDGADITILDFLTDEDSSVNLDWIAVPVDSDESLEPVALVSGLPGTLSPANEVGSGAFEIDESNWSSVSFTPTHNIYGNFSVSISIRSVSAGLLAYPVPAPLMTTTSFQIVINQVDDLPEGTLTTSEDICQVGLLCSGFSLHISEAIGPINVTVSSADALIILDPSTPSVIDLALTEISSNGATVLLSGGVLEVMSAVQFIRVLREVPSEALSHYPQAMVVFSITDFGLNEPLEFIKSLTGVKKFNQPPQALGLVLEMTEETSQTFSVAEIAVNPENDGMILKEVHCLPSYFCSTSVNNTHVTVSPKLDMFGSSVLRCLVADSFNNTGPIDANVTIANVNDPPVVIAPPVLAFIEDGISGIGVWSIIDVDNETISVTIETTSSDRRRSIPQPTIMVPGGTPEIESSAVTVGTNATSIITLTGKAVDITKCMMNVRVTLPPHSTSTIEVLVSAVDTEYQVHSPGIVTNITAVDDVLVRQWQSVEFQIWSDLTRTLTPAQLGVVDVDGDLDLSSAAVVLISGSDQISAEPMTGGIRFTSAGSWGGSEIVGNYSVCDLNLSCVAVNISIEVRGLFL